MAGCGPHLLIMRRGYTRGECTHVKRVRMVAPRDRDPAHSVTNSGLDHLRATIFLIADWVKRCASAKFWAACNVGAARLISVATRDAAATACITGFATGIRIALITSKDGQGIFERFRSKKRPGSGEIRSTSSGSRWKCPAVHVSCCRPKLGE